jgi:hypothetical protein
MRLYYFRHINTFGLSILTRLWERFRKIEDLLRNLCNDVPKVAGSSGDRYYPYRPHIWIIDCEMRRMPFQP